MFEIIDQPSECGAVIRVIGVGGCGGNAVEHMIDRGLTKQPKAAPVILQTATMIQGYGDVYRQGMADWNAIIDGLVKPTFDGVLALTDLAGAVTEARTAVMPDPRQAALKRKIAEIRARAPAGSDAA